MKKLLFILSLQLLVSSGALSLTIARGANETDLGKLVQGGVQEDLLKGVIIPFFEPKDLLNFARVCRYFNDIAEGSLKEYFVERSNQAERERLFPLMVKHGAFDLVKLFIQTPEIYTTLSVACKGDALLQALENNRDKIVALMVDAQGFLSDVFSRRPSESNGEYQKCLEDVFVSAAKHGCMPILKFVKELDSLNLEFIFPVLKGAIKMHQEKVVVFLIHDLKEFDFQNYRFSKFFLRALFYALYKNAESIAILMLQKTIPFKVHFSGDYMHVLRHAEVFDCDRVVRFMLDTEEIVQSISEYNEARGCQSLVVNKKGE